MDGQEDTGLLGDRHHPLQEVFHPLPELLLGHVAEFGRAERLVDVVVVAGDQGTATLGNRRNPFAASRYRPSSCGT